MFSLCQTYQSCFMPFMADHKHKLPMCFTSAVMASLFTNNHLIYLEFIELKGVKYAVILCLFQMAFSFLKLFTYFTSFSCWFEMPPLLHTLFPYVCVFHLFPIFVNCSTDLPTCPPYCFMIGFYHLGELVPLRALFWEMLYLHCCFTRQCGL